MVFFFIVLRMIILFYDVTKSDVPFFFSGFEALICWNEESGIWLSQDGVRQCHEVGVQDNPRENDGTKMPKRTGEDPNQVVGARGH